MLSITLEVPGKTWWTGPTRESREVFTFTDDTGQIRNPDHPWRLVKYLHGWLRFFEVSLVVAAATWPPKDVVVEEPLALGDHIMVDGAEYVIVMRPHWGPELEPVP